MKTANIAELRNHLSRYLSEVKRGDEVLVSERNVPFAKIVPLEHTDDYDAEEMELVAKGAMTLPEIDGPLPESFYEANLPFVKGNRGIEVLLEERYED
jgi:prevent-host-death family protein